MEQKKKKQKKPIFSTLFSHPFILFGIATQPFLLKLQGLKLFERMGLKRENVSGKKLTHILDE